MQQVDDPPSLPVGTEVSAKYKGAFCEAKVRKVHRDIRCKVTYKPYGMGIGTVPDSQIKGTLRVGATVEVKVPEKRDPVEATITKIQDCSQYTVVFDDGDITTLRRSALCLKSGRHFNESETLDQLPLTHPEHFGNPVIGGRRGRRSRHLHDESSDEEDEQDTSKERPVEKEEHIGKVVCVETTETKKKGPKENWFPGLVVAPTAQDTVRIRVKDEYLVRSFKDGRYYTVPKKEATEFTKEIADKQENAAVQAAVEYLDMDILPAHWDRDALFSIANSSSDYEGELDSDSSDNEPREEKDHFVAQLYKHMDDRGTPLNKVASINSKDVDLYRLYRAVQKLGGYNRVTSQNQWKQITQRLGHGTVTLAITSLVKQAYKKSLLPFEEFDRKLGCSMISHPRTNRIKGRSLMRANSVASPKLEKEKNDKEIRHLTSSAASSASSTSTTGATASTKSGGNISSLAEESENTSESSIEPPPPAKVLTKRKLSNASNTTTKVKALVEKFEEKKEFKRSLSKESIRTSRDEGPSTSGMSSSLKRDKPLKKPDKLPTKTMDDDKRGRKKMDKDVEPRAMAEKVEKGSKTHLGDFPIEVGDKLKVFYHEQKVTYEAKVIEIVQKGTPIYLVHYTGWNTRYDEWVTKDRIAENITNTKSKRPKGSKQQTEKTLHDIKMRVQNKSSAKRGRGGSRSDSQPPRSTTPLSNSSRTKSPATPATGHRRTTRGQPHMRRRTSNTTDISSMQTDSDTDSDEPVKKPTNRSPPKSLTNQTTSVSSKTNSNQSSEDDSSTGPKGRDYDLNQIMNELKGFKEMKSPSPEADSIIDKKSFDFPTTESTTATTSTASDQKRGKMKTSDSKTSSDISSETDSFGDDDSQFSDKTTILDNMYDTMEQKYKAGKLKTDVFKKTTPNVVTKSTASSSKPLSYPESRDYAEKLFPSFMEKEHKPVVALKMLKSSEVNRALQRSEKIDKPSVVKPEKAPAKIDKVATTIKPERGPFARAEKPTSLKTDKTTPVKMEKSPIVRIEKSSVKSEKMLSIRMENMSVKADKVQTQTLSMLEKPFTKSSLFFEKALPLKRDNIATSTTSAGAEKLSTLAIKEKPSTTVPEKDVPKPESTPVAASDVYEFREPDVFGFDDNKRQTLSPGGTVPTTPEPIPIPSVIGSTPSTSTKIEEIQQPVEKKAPPQKKKVPNEAPSEKIAPAPKKLKKSPVKETPLVLHPEKPKAITKLVEEKPVSATRSPEEVTVANKPIPIVSTTASFVPSLIPCPIVTTASISVSPITTSTVSLASTSSNPLSTPMIVLIPKIESTFDALRKSPSFNLVAANAAAALLAEENLQQQLQQQQQQQQQTHQQLPQHQLQHKPLLHPQQPENVQQPAAPIALQPSIAVKIVKEDPKQQEIKKEEQKEKVQPITNVGSKSMVPSGFVNTFSATSKILPIVPKAAKPMKTEAIFNVKSSDSEGSKEDPTTKSIEVAKKLLLAEAPFDLDTSKSDKPSSVADKLLKALNQQVPTKQEDEKVETPETIPVAPVIEKPLPPVPVIPPIITPIVTPILPVITAAVIPPVAKPTELILAIVEPPKIEFPAVIRRDIEMPPKKPVLSSPEHKVDILESIAPKNNDLSETIQKLESAIQKSSTLDHVTEDSSDSTDSEQRLVIEDESQSSETQIDFPPKEEDTIMCNETLALESPTDTCSKSVTVDIVPFTSVDSDFTTPRRIFGLAKQAIPEVETPVLMAAQVVCQRTSEPVPEKQIPEPVVVVEVPKIPLVATTVAPATLVSSSLPVKKVEEAPADSSISLYCEETIPGSPAQPPLSYKEGGEPKKVYDIPFVSLHPMTSDTKPIPMDIDDMKDNNKSDNATPNSSSRDSISQDDSSEEAKKHGQEHESPLKKRRRTKRTSESECNAKKKKMSTRRSAAATAGSDSDENSDVGTMQRPSSHRTINPCQYNFLVQLDPNMSPGQRVSVLKKKMTELRKTYNAIKAELASIDRRRKKLRRRERENKKQQLKLQQTT